MAGRKVVRYKLQQFDGGKEGMRKKDVVALVIVVSFTVALLVGIFAFQYFQSSIIPPEDVSASDAISIVMQKQNNTAYTKEDYVASFVYLKGDGKVYQADATTNQVGNFLTTTKAPQTGGSYFSWQVKNEKDNSTFYVDSADGSIISSSG